MDISAKVFISWDEWRAIILQLADRTEMPQALHLQLVRHASLLLNEDTVIQIKSRDSEGSRT